jgi:hypothetical protein
VAKEPEIIKRCFDGSPWSDLRLDLQRNVERRLVYSGHIHKNVGWIQVRRFHNWEQENGNGDPNGLPPC